MKFAIVTLCTLALALGVQSSILPWGGVVTQVAGHALAHTAVVSPLGHLGLGHPGAAVAVHAPLGLPHLPSVAVHAPVAVPNLPSVAVHAAVAAPNPPSVAIHAPVALPAPIPAAVHAAPVVVPGHAASYVAKTRGAVHAAPLAGHLNSVANVNVAPAPGTW